MRVLNIFRGEMFTLFFAISLGVRPISPGRSARSARSVEPAQRENFGSFISQEVRFVQSSSLWLARVREPSLSSGRSLLNAASGCQISQATVCPSCPASCAVVVKVVVSVCVGVGAEPGP